MEHTPQPDPRRQRQRRDSRRVTVTPDTGTARSTNPDQEYAFDQHEGWAWQRVRKINLLPPAAEDGKKFDASKELKDLIKKRARYAKSMSGARRGKIVGSTKRQPKNLDGAHEDYLKARERFIAAELDSLDDKTTNDQKRAFAAALNAREDGVLAGEEAQYYVAQNSKETKLDKAFERYNKLGTPTKVAAALGVTALVGFTAGGLTAGALFASRFGKKLFTEEAKLRHEEAAKREGAGYLRDIQNRSALHTSNQALYRDQYRSARDSGDTAIPLHNDRLKAEHDTLRGSALEEQKELTAQKRKTQRKALGRAALVAGAGGLIGYFLESGTGWHGVLRGWVGDGWFGNGDIDIIDNPPSDPNNGEDTDGLGSTHRPEDFTDHTNAEPRIGSEGPLGDENEALNNPNVIVTDVPIESVDIPPHDHNISFVEDTAEFAEPVAAEPELISERSEYLFGELAGETVEVYIAEGDTVWHSLEHMVEAQNPYICEEEKQRIVANMLHQMEHTYPGRNFDLVYPGEVFCFNLPAQA